MNDKFTLRDFFAYFLSGIVILLFLSANFFDYAEMIYEKRSELKDHSAVVIFFSIPIAYFIGQILHGIDTIIFFVASKSRKFAVKIRPKKFYNPLWLIFFVLNAYRISGSLHLRNLDQEKFWETCAKLQVEKQFSACEYWYVMNDLFKGLSLASLIFLVISIIQSNWYLVIVYLFLYLFFWVRALFFAKSFIETVRRTELALSETVTNNG